MNLMDLRYQLYCARNMSASRYYAHIANYPASRLSNIDYRAIDQEIALTHAFGGQFIFHDSPAYPEQLKCISLPPPVLVCKGDIGLLQRNTCAVVGSRRATAASLEFTKTIVQELSAHGQVIVSGLAAGVDAQAHRYAQSTIAVLGCGINVYYPAENRQLQDQLYARHLTVTEYPYDFSVKKENFPKRNNIIAGLSWCVLIMQAEQYSGSMLTAKLGLEQGKTIFAVPGHPLDTRFAGCNALIQDGAQVLLNARDVLDQTYAHTTNPAAQVRPSTDSSEFAAEQTIVEATAHVVQQSPAQQAGFASVPIFDFISHTPIGIESLSLYSGIDIAVILTQLTELEVMGLIVIDHQDRVSRI